MEITNYSFDLIKQEDGSYVVLKWDVDSDENGRPRLVGMYPMSAEDAERIMASVPDDGGDA